MKLVAIASVQCVFTMLGGVLLFFSVQDSSDSPEASSGVVKCRELILEGPDGQPRGRWGVEDDGKSRIALFDAEGEIALELFVEAGRGDGATVRLYNHPESPGLELTCGHYQHGNYTAIQSPVVGGNPGFRISADSSAGVTVGLGTGDYGTLGAFLGPTSGRAAATGEAEGVARLEFSAGASEINAQIGRVFDWEESGSPRIELKAPGRVHVIEAE